MVIKNWPARLFIFTSIQLRAVFTMFKHDLKCCLDDGGAPLFHPTLCVLDRRLLMVICEANAPLSELVPSVFTHWSSGLTTFYRHTQKRHKPRRQLRKQSQKTTEGKAIQHLLLSAAVCLITSAFCTTGLRRRRPPCR